MKLQGSAGQPLPHPLYDASGTITTGGTAQLILPNQPSRSHLFIQNISAANLYVEFGPARVTATISGGKVTGFTVVNGGFGYTVAPLVRCEGGGNGENNLYDGIGWPGGYTPHSPATAVATVAGGAVTTVTLTNGGGANYAIAPYVDVENRPMNPNGCVTPSATSGILLVPNGSLTYEGTNCTTWAVAIFGASNGQGYTCKWMD